MKFIFHLPTKQARPSIFAVFLLAALLLSLPLVSPGQTPPQLSLADILIALRSKKVTLVERNMLLADAIATRGITFGLTPEIERELVNTGADAVLVRAIRQKSPTPKIVAAATPNPSPKTEPTPIVILTPTPTPAPIPPALDAAFYRTRANAHIVKAEYQSALYDYDKAIELSPDDSTAYFYRGDSYEKMGNLQKAAEDYQKAFELDPINEPAKNNLQRLRAGQSKTAPNPQIKEAASFPEPAAAPQSVELGQLKSYAVKLAVPVYPTTAKQLKVEGAVTVKMTLDEAGNVVSAKATAGNMLLRAAGEEAALKSKFKPARVGNQAVKATGYIIYNFVR